MKVKRARWRWVGVAAVALLAAEAAFCDGDADLKVALQNGLALTEAKGTRAGTHDIELTLSRRDGKWRTRVWGYAGSHNLSLHPGKLIDVQDEGGSLTLKVELELIAERTGVPGAAVDWHYRPPGESYFRPVAKGDWTVRLKRAGEAWTGRYTGTCDGRAVKGVATAAAGEPFPPRVDAHGAAAGEHPRLLFCKRELPALRRRARTPEGKRILSRMRELLTIQERGGFSYHGMRDGTAAEPYTQGYHIAAYAFLHVLTGQSGAIEQIQRLLGEAMRPPGEMGGWGAANRILGVALAYDMVGDLLDRPLRRKVKGFLRARSLARCGPPGSHYHAGFHAIALLCGEALRGEVKQPHLLRNREHSELALRRYLRTGLGEKGFGGEYAGQGELLRDMLPALYAYRHATGSDLITGTGLEWVGLHKLMVPQSRRNRMIDWGPALLAARPAHASAIRRRIDEELAGFRYPITGVCRLLACRFQAARPPAKADLPLTLVDRLAGGCVFRSGWDDAAAVVTVDSRQNAAATPVTAMNYSLRALGTAWVRWRPPDYGVFWLPRPERNKPNVPRLPGLLPVRGAEVTDVETRPDGSGQVSMRLDHYATAEPWVFKTTPCFQHQVPDATDAGVTVERTVAVDYSGRCGTPVLVVVVDRIRGTGKTMPIWTMNLAKQVVPVGEDLVGKNRSWNLPQREIENRLAELLAVTQKGGERRARPTVRPLPRKSLLFVGPAARQRGRPVPPIGERPTMQFTMLSPAAALLSIEPRFHGHDLRSGRILATAGKGPADFIAVITVQRGEAPAVRASGSGRNATVTVGPSDSGKAVRTIRFHGSRVLFE